MKKFGFLVFCTLLLVSCGQEITPTVAPVKTETLQVQVPIVTPIGTETWTSATQMSSVNSWTTAEETTTFDKVCQNKSIEWMVQNAYKDALKIQISASWSKKTSGTNYMLRWNTIIYVSATYAEIESPEETYISSYDCISKKSTRLTQSIVSGLYAGVNVIDFNKDFVLYSSYVGEYSLPGSSTFGVYSLETKKNFVIDSSKNKVIEDFSKDKKLDTERDIVTIESIRLGTNEIEARVVLNHNGNSEADLKDSLPSYELVSEKWIPIELK